MSLLTSLLLHDNIVSPRKIDEAIQRQVIAGGDFETALLEVGALAEDTLAAYYSALVSLPAASREDVLEADPSAVARLSRDLARAHGAVPLRVEDGVLLLAVSTPLDTDALTALRASVGRPVALRVITPPRLAWALWRYYQHPLSVRLGKLAEKLHAAPAGELIEVKDSSLRAVHESQESGRSLARANNAFAALNALLDDDDDEVSRSSSPAPPAPEPAPALVLPPEARVPLLATEAPPDPPRLSLQEHPAPETARGDSPPRPIQSRVPDEPGPPTSSPSSTDKLFSEAPASTLDSRRGITLAEARRRLASSSTRDAVLEALLDHALAGFQYVALFVVQNNELHGLASRGRGASTTALRAMTMSLPRVERVREVCDEGGARVVSVPLGSGEALLRTALGRGEVTDVVLAAIKIKSRTALVLWADLGGRVPPATAALALEEFISECSSVFERIILDKKRASSAPPPGPSPVPSIIPSLSPRTSRPNVPSRASRLAALKGVVTSRSPKVPAPAPLPSDLDIASKLTPASRPAALSTAEPVFSSAHSSSLDVGAEAERIVREAAQTGQLAERSIAALLALGERALDAVFKHFPGPHELVRGELGAKLPAMSDSGPLLRLVVTFRHAAVPRLIETLDDPDPDRRYCALLCLGEVAHPSAISRLIPALLAGETSTRDAALTVLKSYRRFTEFSSVGRSLRTLLRDVRAPTDQRVHAARALAEFRDIDSVPVLIASLADPDNTVVTAVHRALVDITRQDFGNGVTSWSDWWQHAQHRHRIEWLIDALLSTDAALRHEASEELKKLTGQFFGYYFNLPRRERERAHQRYIEWWRREGTQHFSGHGSNS